MLAANLGDFLEWSELSDVPCVLCVIAVCLFFIVGWCFFDVLWRVFLHKVKFLVVLLSLCCVLAADWETNVSYIAGDIDTIRGDVSIIRNKVQLIEGYNDQTSDDVHYLVNSFKKKQTNDDPALFFTEMLYGVKMVRDPNSENTTNYVQSVPSHGYDSLFGLRLGYKDLTPDYYNLINKYSSAGTTPANFNVERFVTDRDQLLAQTPDSFLAYGNLSDFLTYKDTSFTASDGMAYTSRDNYVMYKMSEFTNYDRQEIDYLKRWASAASDGVGVFSNLDGTVLSFNLDWLADYANAIFPLVRSGGTDQEPQYINWLSEWRNRRFTFSLVPRAASEGDEGTTHFLLPLYNKWQEYRSIVNAAFAVLCYGSVILFISDKVRALVEGS